jgi:hypothetical protein
VAETLFVANDTTVCEMLPPTTVEDPLTYIVSIKQPPVSLDRKSLTQMSLQANDSSGKPRSTLSWSYSNQEIGAGDDINISADSAVQRNATALVDIAHWNAGQNNLVGVTKPFVTSLGAYTYIPMDFSASDSGFIAGFTDAGEHLLSSYNAASENSDLAGLSAVPGQVPGHYDTIQRGDSAATPWGESWSTWKFEMLNADRPRPTPTGGDGAITNPGYIDPMLGSSTIIRLTSNPDSLFLNTYGFDEATWSVSSGADANVVLFTNKAGPVLEDLPHSCFDGYQTRITTDPDSESDYYFLKYDVEAQAWIESLEKNEEYALDASTMPHVFQYNRDTKEVTFGEYTWTDRKVGDVETHRAPSFIGQSVNELAFFQDRLVLASGQNVVFSETQEPGSFWRKSMLTLLDTDRVDLAMTSSGQGSGTVVSITPTPEGILAFTNRTQFLITAGDSAFTGGNIRVETLGQQPASILTTPVMTQDLVYFVAENGGSSRLWEYGLSESGTAHPVDVSGHVPTLLEGTVRSITPSPADNEILIVTSSGNLFTYRYLQSGESRIQAAWSRWDLGSGLPTESTMMVDTTQYICTPEYLYEVKDHDYLDACGYGIRVDQRQPVISAGQSQLADGTYAVLLPITPVAPPPGDLIDPAWVIMDTDTGEQWSPTGFPFGIWASIAPNPDTHNLVWGIPIEMSIEFSRYVPKQEGQGRARPILGGRSQLKTFSITYSNTGAFDIISTITNDEYTSTHSNTGQLTDDPFGPPFPTHGTFRADVGGSAAETTIRFVSSDALPVEISSARYELIFYRRGN